MRNLNSGIALVAGESIGKTICRRPERPSGVELHWCVSGCATRLSSLRGASAVFYCASTYYQALTNRTLVLLVKIHR